MEVEAKFRVEDVDLFAKLLAFHSLGSFTFEATREAEFQKNTYFDTEDGRIRRTQHALRVRTVGKKRIASLKSPTLIVGAVHQRGEWEVEIGDDASPASWPPSEARDRALALVGAAPLQPVVEIHTTRRNIHVDFEGSPLADLCLDEGTIFAGGRILPFRELEVELVAQGCRSEFDALVLKLEHDQQLAREPKSKFARGLELLDNQ